MAEIYLQDAFELEQKLKNEPRTVIDLPDDKKSYKHILLTKIEENVRYETDSYGDYKISDEKAFIDFFNDPKEMRDVAEGIAETGGKILFQGHIENLVCEKDKDGNEKCNLVKER